MALAPTRVLMQVNGGLEDWKEPYKQFLLALKGADGYYRYRWGPVEGAEGKLDIVASWESSEKLAAFGKSAEHQKAVEALAPIIKGGVPAKCPRFDLDNKLIKPPPPLFFDCAFCEMVTIEHFAGDAEAVNARIANASKVSGCVATHGGLVRKDHPDRGTVYMAWIGWSDEASAKGADSERKNYLPDSSAGQVESHLINFNYPIKGYSVTNPGR